ncbi:hypothetical protein [Actinoplanes derwentensis]|nr:hypothetical protein [Actinoplanes derwentensis]
MSHPIDVVFDPAAAHPETVVLRAAVTAGDWPGCRAVLDSVAPMARTGLIRLVGGAPDIEDFLREVLRADPSDGTASALLGQHLLHIGWTIRAETRAWYEDDDRPTRFRDQMCRAERVLIDGAVFNPVDPAIWSARLVSARGLGLGPAETRRRYDRLTVADPDHLPGQFDMARSLSPEWGGTWELMHEFAREAVAAAPSGGAHGALVAAAHLDHGLDKSVYGQSTAETLTGYLSKEQVRAEIHQAAERSVGHPGFTRGHGWLEALNTFALCFTLLGDQQAAAAAFERMDGLAVEEPWSHLGDAATEFGKARDRALGGDR